jgi:hypothetical protein
VSCLAAVAGNKNMSGEKGAHDEGWGFLLLAQALRLCSQ